MIPGAAARLWPARPRRGSLEMAGQGRRRTTAHRHQGGGGNVEPPSSFASRAWRMWMTVASCPAPPAAGAVCAGCAGSWAGRRRARREHGA